MPASISYQSNVRPGEFNPFKGGIPGKGLAPKASVKTETSPKKQSSGIGSHTFQYIKDAMTVPLKLIGIVRHTTNAAALVLNKSSPVISTIKATKYFSLIALPFGIWDFFSAAKDFFTATRPDQRFDAGLSVVGELSGIMDSTVTMAEGLNDVGLVTKNAISWTAPLATLSAALSVSSMIFTSRSLWQTAVFYKELTAQPGLSSSKGHTLDDYIKGIDYFRSKEASFLKKHFKVDGGKLKDQLDRIHQEAQKALQSGNAIEVDEAGKKLQKTIKSLKGRVTNKIVNNSVSLVGSTVGLIGVGILLTQPHLSPISYSLFAVSSALSLGRFIYEEVERRKFEKDIGIRQPKPPKVVTA